MSAPFNEYGPFAVGEICRVVYSTHCPELIGSEVQIKSAPTWCRSIEGRVWFGYGTNIEGYTPPESYLRRRRPPASHTGERMFMQHLRDFADRLRQGEPA